MFCGYCKLPSSDAEKVISPCPTQWLMRNSTWRGDVIFNMQACLIAADVATQPPAYKRLLQQKLGYTIMIHGTARHSSTRPLLSST